MEIQFSPYIHLSCLLEKNDTKIASSISLHKIFQKDWREGLFQLGAEKPDCSSAPTLLYWREFAELYLVGLCHISEEIEEWTVEEPSLDALEHLLLAAPPMRGGEYLNQTRLLSVWNELEGWVRENASFDGLEHFLQIWAPKWHQVGRVCFHLAENKNNEELPFAFLATYITGLGRAGKAKHLPLGRALKEYAGTQNKSKLVKLLTPVQQACEACSWVEDLLETGRIYQPIAWSTEQAYIFLRSVSLLEESGLSVRVPDWWKKRPRARVSVTIGEQNKSKVGADAMLDFSLKVALGEHTLSKEEMAELLASNDGLVLFKGEWVEVDREKLEEAITQWENIQEHAENGEISFIEGMRLLAGASVDLKEAEELEDGEAWAHVTAGRAMREMLSALRDPSQLAAVDLKKTLKATLRPYQERGLSWLTFLSKLGLGACLADDMGLGKTIQVLALLLHRKQDQKKSSHRSSILVIPASLLGNWRDEAERFTPSLRLTFIHPSETPRRELKKIADAPKKYLKEADLFITTYAMLSRQKWLADQHWDLAILDEAQAIKNPMSQQTKATKELSASSRIILTGTPIENRLGDLWSLFDFVNPGLLGSVRVFQSFVKGLESRDHDQFAPLRQLVSPYILRRMKTDPSIIEDLPNKTETTCFCQLTKQQVKMYQQVIKKMSDDLKEKEGLARRGVVLQALMRLKQVCNHPSQLSGDEDFLPKNSGKFLRLAEICEELAARQEKVLIFTQFREIIDPLEEHLSEVFSRPGLILHGGTSVKKRKAIVKDFQREDGPPFFILSLKAGGTGLNLTAANHVIHFDRWWNPAVENQATDRAFRIGQKKNVLVHKFVTTGTIEERIDSLIREKQELADQLLSGKQEVNFTEMGDDELLDLVRLDLTRATF